MRRLFTLVLVACGLMNVSAQEQIEMTLNEAKTLYGSVNGRRYAGAHDPSIVYDHTQNRFYIFGTHQSWAWTADMQTTPVSMSPSSLTMGHPPRSYSIYPIVWQN